MGDTFRNIKNATIVNRSLVQDSINKVRAEAGEEAAEALKKIAHVIQASGNENAAAFFQQFNEELQRPEPRKTLLRASWDNLVKALPTVTTVAGAVGAITKLFAV